MHGSGFGFRKSGLETMNGTYITLWEMKIAVKYF
jgi:hypothetical protein